MFSVNHSITRCQEYQLNFHYTNFYFIYIRSANAGNTTGFEEPQNRNYGLSTKHSIVVKNGKIMQYDFMDTYIKNENVTLTVCIVKDSK